MLVSGPTRQQFMDSWLKQPTDWAGSSHLPVLRALLKCLPIRSVLEFGVGVFSTHEFLQYDVELHSVETGLEWYRHAQHWYHEHPKAPSIELHPDVSTYLLPRDRVDLLFVDGEEEQRGRFLSLFGQRADCIVLHDTNGFAKYGYDRANIPASFHGYRLITPVYPWTDFYLRNPLTPAVSEYLMNPDNLDIFYPCELQELPGVI